MRHIYLVIGLALCLAGCGDSSSDSGWEEKEAGTGLSYTASTNVQGEGQIQPASLAIPEGQTGDFTLTPAPGYGIGEASGCGGVLSGTRYTTAVMSGDCEIRVSFVSHAKPSYTASASTGAQGGGQIQPASLLLDEGQTGTFTVTPAPGYTTSEVTGCGGELKGTRYTTAAMNASCQITASFISNVALALQRQDHRLASEQELIDFARQTIAGGEQTRQALIVELYQGSGISWHPSHDSVSFTTYIPTHTFNILPANQNGDGNPVTGGLVMATDQAQRMAAMASSLFSVSTSPDTDLLLKRLIHWLTRGQDEVQGLSVVTAQQPSSFDTYWFPYNEGIRRWLKDNYPESHGINDINSCDYAALASCITAQKPDLIILGDYDSQKRGFAGIADAVKQAKAAGIPLLLTNRSRDASPMLTPLYQEMGLTVSNNYWAQLQAKDLDAATIKADDPKLVAADKLLADLHDRRFDMSVLDNCQASFLNCDDPDFATAFKTGADWLRSASDNLDRRGINPFDDARLTLLQASLLLADKYRSTIDYPIAWSESAAWQQAMFADWLVSYARPTNQAQPDLGQFVVDASQVKNGSNASYRFPPTQSDRKQISTPYSDQWTTTGWYALPGQAITLTRHDNADTDVQIKLNYHRSNTNRASTQKVYRGPMELMTQRLTLAKGASVQFSSPYGGPIYLYLSGSGSPLSVDVTADGIAKHPTIMDFSDEAQLAAFEDAIQNTELPHVDLRSDGAEQHMRRDHFVNAFNTSMPDTRALLKSIANDHINTVYTLAGFKIMGKSLAQSLPADEQAICVDFFGQDCLDETLHIRRTIQHANYDQNAQCGSGCSGNPWDASWNISPTGWGDNHELGHNLQVNKLNVQYVSATNSDSWPSYSNRAGENSNNIFPYVVQWRAHYLRDGNMAPIADGHSDHNEKDIFFAFMSDAAGVTDSAGQRVVLDSSCHIIDAGTDHFTAPWLSNDYAVHNSYRMGFYLQIPLRVNGMTFADGKVLGNGFSIYTLLYQHSRIFDKYSGDETSWNAHRDQMGFGLFPFNGHAVYGGKSIGSIPGNDFMLVSLSKLTGYDWSSHFTLLGLRYTSLAGQQAALNGSKGPLPMGIYDTQGNMPPLNMSQGLTFVPLSTTDASTLWPDGSSPAKCPTPAPRL